MKVIVGLGNPGKEYKKTYHNLGFIAVEDVAISLNAKFNKNECNALTAETYLNGEKIILAKPQTFMNLSGLSVKSLLAKYNALPIDLIVIYDDYDINLGKIRVRAEGSAGSHNGMKSIVKEIGSNNFARIRIGINNNDSSIEIIDYVLTQINKKHFESLAISIKSAADCAILLAKGTSIETAMQAYN